MTEAEWLGCNEPRRMLDFLAASYRRLSERKLRLFACACAREVEDCTTREGCIPISELAERYADGRADLTEVQAAADKVEYAAYGQVYAIGDAFGVLQATLRPDAFESATEAAKWLNGFYSYDAPECRDCLRTISFCRDIFGDPFHPIAFDPVWRTDTALSLARQMYDAREFSAMPILADALQDAGCDSDDILNHCRDPKQVHVRGCWAVDLLTDRT